MKTYREQYNDLHFSPEEKQAMVENLLAAVPETHRRVSHKKRVHILIAAVIAAALCAACASGALQAAIQSLSFFLGNQPEQTQVLGEMAQPIGVDRDEKEAVAWLERASEQEFPRAQSILADCLQAGRGTERDLERAAVLLSLIHI